MLGIGERIIKKALKMGVESAEAFLMRTSETSVELEKNTITLGSTTTSFGIGIRIIKAQRLGFSYCSELSKVAPAIESAIKISKSNKKSKFEFPANKKFTRVKKIYDKKLETLTPKNLLELGSELVNGVKSINKKVVLTAGLVSVEFTRSALVNSEGTEFEENGSRIDVAASTVLKAREISTGFDFGSSRLFDLDCRAVGENASKLAVATQGTKKVASGMKNVIFMPYAFASLLQFGTIPSFYGSSAKKGESVYSNKLNKLVASENLNIIENSIMENGLNSSSIDDEGIPSYRVPIIENGVLKNYLYDLTTAYKYKTKSTANGMRCEPLDSRRNFKAQPTVRARNIVIDTKAKKHTLEELLSVVRNGILVHSVLGAHTINPASGDFSVSSSILFEVENSELKNPCKPIMLSGKLQDCLRNVIALGKDYKKVPGRLAPTSIVVPSLAIEKIMVIS
jgi:PmbA protein